MANFAYTKDDRVKSITYGNGIQTTYTYDNRGRATRILVKDGAVTKLDLNYAYTGNGDVQSIDDGTAPIDETYTYDSLDRFAVWNNWDFPQKEDDSRYFLRGQVTTLFISRTHQITGLRNS